MTDPSSPARVRGSLLIIDTERIVAILALLNLAARPFGWAVRAQTATGEDIDPERDQEQARTARARFRLPAIRIAAITASPREDGDPLPVDAERLLERARVEARLLDEDALRRASVLPDVDSATALLRGVALDGLRNLNRAPGTGR